MSTRVILDVYTVHQELIRQRMTKAQLANSMGISRVTLNFYLQNPDRVQLKTITTMAESLKHPYVKDLIKEVEVQ